MRLSCLLGAQQEKPHLDAAFLTYDANEATHGSRKERGKK
jgi:hypothetical protein